MDKGQRHNPSADEATSCSRVLIDKIPPTSGVRWILDKAYGYTRQIKHVRGVQIAPLAYMEAAGAVVI